MHASCITDSSSSRLCRGHRCGTMWGMNEMIWTAIVGADTWEIHKQAKPQSLGRLSRLRLTRRNGGETGRLVDWYDSPLPCQISICQQASSSQLSLSTASGSQRSARSQSCLASMFYMRSSLGAGSHWSIGRRVLIGFGRSVLTSKVSKSGTHYTRYYTASDTGRLVSPLGRLPVIDYLAAVSA